jgi:hypothetical protein
MAQLFIFMIFKAFNQCENYRKKFFRLAERIMSLEEMRKNFLKK